MSVVPLGLPSTIGSQPQVKTWGYLPLSLRDILANNHLPLDLRRPATDPVRRSSNHRAEQDWDSATFFRYWFVNAVQFEKKKEQQK